MGNNELIIFIQPIGEEGDKVEKKLNELKIKFIPILKLDGEPVIIEPSLRCPWEGLDDIEVFFATRPQQAHSPQ